MEDLSKTIEEGRNNRVNYRFKTLSGDWTTVSMNYECVHNEIEILKQSRIHLNLQTPAGKLYCTREMIPTVYATPVELGKVCKFMAQNLSECSLWINTKDRFLVGIAPNGDILGIRFRWKFF